MMMRRVPQMMFACANDVDLRSNDVVALPQIKKANFGKLDFFGAGDEI